jgi:N-acetylmuramoyl-L-alanine amidase
MQRESIARAVAFCFVVFVAALLSARVTAQSPAPAQVPATSQTAPAAPAEKPYQFPSPPPALVILDPAHGGSDSGAHGGLEGAVEKDLVLTIAQSMRQELERQGVRVVLTRQGDATVSIDDRAALANSLGGGFFVTLHVGSKGDANTAEAYSFGTPIGGAPPANQPRPPGVDLLRWEDAQAAYVLPSRRFAEILQVELAQRLRGSADRPQFAQLRQLRVVAHPAVAIELSYVGEQNASALEKTGTPLAGALLRAISVYRQPVEARP